MYPGRLLHFPFTPAICAAEVGRTQSSPTRSGPEGSSRNEFAAGRSGSHLQTAFYCVATPEQVRDDEMLSPSYSPSTSAPAAPKTERLSDSDAADATPMLGRSEERRGGTGCVSKCRSRGSP